LQYYGGEYAFCFVLYDEMVQRNNGTSTSYMVV
jgi:hypothetical protein